MKFDNEVKQKYFDYVVDQIENGANHNYILTGQTGRGKTFLATEIAKHFNGRVMFIPNLLSNMKQEMLNYNDYSPIRFVSKRSKPNVIVLDDLGGRKLSDWEIDQIFRIADYQKAIYIITTNLSSKELNDILGERTMSRLLENMNSKDVFKAEGSDRRLKVAF